VPQRKQGWFADFCSGFLSLFKGLRVTGHNLVARDKITLQYPYERDTVAPRYRGLFYLPFDEEAGRLKCVGCTLCEQACPTRVISMVKLGTGKHAGVSEFDMDLGRCMFCNLCIEACPFDAIHMSEKYELASTNRDACLFDIVSLTPGGAPNVERNNTNISAALEEEARLKAEKAAAAGAAAAAHQPPAPQASGEATHG
jgi:Formate hydrogenlyase subunit 6/NADH:ubiquinone oxidoreductase 23 kD subunit (chain I)